MDDFTKYMLDFYGPKGIYSELKFTTTEIILATQLYKTRLPADEEFCGDSLDRELVRDIVLNARGVEAWGTV